MASGRWNTLETLKIMNYGDIPERVRNTGGLTCGATLGPNSITFYGKHYVETRYFGDSSEAKREQAKKIIKALKTLQSELKNVYELSFLGYDTSEMFFMSGKENIECSRKIDKLRKIAGDDICGIFVPNEDGDVPTENHSVSGIFYSGYLSFEEIEQELEDERKSTYWDCRGIDFSQPSYCYAEYEY